MADRRAVIVASLSDDVNHASDRTATTGSGPSPASPPTRSPGRASGLQGAIGPLAFDLGNEAAGGVLQRYDLEPRASSHSPEADSAAVTACRDWPAGPGVPLAVTAAAVTGAVRAGSDSDSANLNAGCTPPQAAAGAVQVTASGANGSNRLVLGPPGPASANIAAEASASESELPDSVSVRLADRAGSTRTQIGGAGDFESDVPSYGGGARNLQVESGESDSESAGAAAGNVKFKSPPARGSESEFESAQALPGVSPFTSDSDRLQVVQLENSTALAAAAASSSGSDSESPSNPSRWGPTRSRRCASDSAIDDSASESESESTSRSVTQAGMEATGFTDNRDGLLAAPLPLAVAVTPTRTLLRPTIARRGRLVVNPSRSHANAAPGPDSTRSCDSFDSAAPGIGYPRWELD